MPFGEAPRWKENSMAFCQDSRVDPYDGECHVAGTSHRAVREIEPGLIVGGLLPLKREPENEHDALAIMILDEKGNHLGYVPRAKNEALARLMDAGKLLFGKVENKTWRGDWLEIQIRIFMRDF
jgi:hypothetical protein